MVSGMSDKFYTNVKIDEKVYSIKKFTAKEGLMVARLLMAKVLALIPVLDIPAPKKNDDIAPQLAEGGEGNTVAIVEQEAADSKSSDALYTAIAQVLENLTESDMTDLIDKCLRVCYVQLPAGLQPIIDATGHYGVPDVEYDLPLTLRLCFEAIKWGASDFFGDKSSLSPLTSLLAGFQRNQ